MVHVLILSLIVVAGDGPSLFVWDWFKEIKLDWKTIGLTTLDIQPVQLPELLQKYESVYQSTLGTIDSFQADLKLKDSSSKPVFKQAWPVPFALREVLGAELDRLESEGILRKVTHSDWASPIFIVPKGTMTIGEAQSLCVYNDS